MAILLQINPFTAFLEEKKARIEHPEPLIEHAGQVSTEHAACFPASAQSPSHPCRYGAVMTNAGVNGLIFSRQFRIGCLVDEMWVNPDVENFVSFGFMVSPSVGTVSFRRLSWMVPGFCSLIPWL
jgi:hypothetical protein